MTEKRFYQTVGLASGLADTRVLALVAVLVLVWFYHWPALPSPAWLVGPLILSLLRFPGRIMLAVTTMVLAVALLQSHWQMAKRWPVADHGRLVWLEGQVVDLPEVDAFRTRFILRTHQPVRRLRLSWYGRAPVIRPGDTLRLQVRMATPHGSLNPGGFDYAGWLWQAGIDGTGYVRKNEVTHQSARWSVDRWRFGALQRLAPLLEGHAMRGLIEAISLGARDHISPAQWQVFRDTGTSHLMAISGLHVGLVAGWLFALARWLALRSSLARQAIWLAALVGITGALGYAAMAGWALPTQRAVIMTGVFFLALASRRRIGADRALAWAALAVVLWQPAAVVTPGFWLSFLAVAWLVWLASYGRGAWWWRLLIFQLGLVVMLMPLTLWFFARGSLVAPVTNAILIPAAGFIVPLLLLAVLLAVLWPGAWGSWLLLRLADALEAGWPGLEWVAQQPLSAFSWVLPGGLALGLAIMATLIIAMPLPWRLRLLGLCLCLPAVLGWRPAGQDIPAGSFRLTVLDVGQGLASVVQTRHHTLVYDAGPAFRTGFDAGSMIVVPYLRHIGRLQVDQLMISHADLDHIGGAEAVMQQARVSRRTGAASNHQCLAGQSWRWDGVDFRVLYPARRDLAAATSRNDNSCVVQIQAPGQSALLTGDLEMLGERLLVARLGKQLRSDVLVVPHHGSATSSTAEFLAAVQPQVGLFAAGWRNRWGHPRPEVVARYRQRDIALFNTATGGALLVDWPEAGRPRVQRWREQQRRFWHKPSVEL